MKKHTTKDKIMPTSEKIQLNIYIPSHLNDYIERVKDETGLHKSDIVHLVIAYARQHFTNQDILNLSEQMILFGEPGLERVET